MANPLTPERLAKLRDDAVEFFKAFGLLYGKNYGVAVFNKIKKELEGPEESPPWKLNRRNFDTIPRVDLFKSYAFMQKGRGLGDFRGWKKVYVVERQDFGIDIFADEQAFLQGNRDVTTIQTAGYEVIGEHRVREHFKKEMRHLASGLGMSDDQVSAYAADLSSDCVALAHPQRVNYIFKLTGSESSCCVGCCWGLCAGLLTMCSSAPAEVGPAPEDNNDDVEKNGGGESRDTSEFQTFLKKCTSKADPREEQKKNIAGKAFEKTCQQLPDKIEALKKWKDDGTEDEILTDLLMETCVPELHDAILQDLNGPIFLRVLLWYRAQAAIMTTLEECLRVGWTGIQQQVAKIEEKITPVIHAGMSRITPVIQRIQEKIKNLILRRIGELLARYVTPSIESLFKSFEEPLKEGFAIGRTLLTEQIKLTELPADVAKRNAILDVIPRSKHNQEKLCTPLKGRLLRTLDELKEGSDVFKELFEDVDLSELKDGAHQSILEMVDSGVFTLEKRLDDNSSTKTSGAVTSDALLDQMLRNYDNDVMIARASFVCDVTKSVLLSGFKKITSPVTKPVFDQIEEAIPEDMRDFLNVEHEMDKFLEFLVGTPIEEMVAAAYPQPK